MFGLVSKKKYIEEVEKNKGLMESVYSLKRGNDAYKKRLIEVCKDNNNLRKEKVKFKEVIEFKDACITGYNNTVNTLKKKEEDLINSKKEELINAAKENLLHRLDDFRSKTRNEMFNRIDSTGYVKVVSCEDEMRKGIEIMKLKVLDRAIEDFKYYIDESIKDIQQKL